MKDQQLSTNFWLDEFLQSDTARRLGIRMDNPPPDVIGNLTRLCTHVLEPIREIWKKPLLITSGWRPRELNEAVGGSERSDHIVGRACDFRIQGVGILAVAQMIEFRGATQNLPIGQLILEFPPNGWVHVSLAKVAGNIDVLTAYRKPRGQGTYYKPGLFLDPV